MNHNKYMKRCFELARLGEGAVAPNPMVGAVLVYQGEIIGEGYHQKYGGPHAEVNAIAAVKEEQRHLIAQSQFYVSLEPCFHYGKTPPCVDLILRHNIPEVIISVIDPNPLVSGKTVEKLKANKVKVTHGVLAEEGQKLIATFAKQFSINHP